MFVTQAADAIIVPELGTLVVPENGVRFIFYGLRPIEYWIPAFAGMTVVTGMTVGVGMTGKSIGKGVRVHFS